MSSFKQNGAWLPSETVHLVALANALGVQLNPKETNTQALVAITIRVGQLVEANAELEKVLAALEAKAR